MEQNSKVNLYVNARSFSLHQAVNAAPTKIARQLEQRDGSCSGCHERHSNIASQRVQANIYVCSQPYMETTGQNVVPNYQQRQSNLSPVGQRSQPNTTAQIKYVFPRSTSVSQVDYKGNQNASRMGKRQCWHKEIEDRLKSSDTSTQRSVHCSGYAGKPAVIIRKHVSEHCFERKLSNLAPVQDHRGTSLNHTLHPKTAVPLPMQTLFPFHHVLSDPLREAFGYTGCQFKSGGMCLSCCTDAFSFIGLQESILQSSQTSANLHCSIHRMKRAAAQCAQACSLPVSEWSGATHCSSQACSLPVAEWSGATHCSCSFVPCTVLQDHYSTAANCSELARRTLGAEDWSLSSASRNMAPSQCHRACRRIQTADPLLHGAGIRKRSDYPSITWLHNYDTTSAKSEDDAEVSMNFSPCPIDKQSKPIASGFSKQIQSNSRLMTEELTFPPNLIKDLMREVIKLPDEPGNKDFREDRFRAALYSSDTTNQRDGREIPTLVNAENCFDMQPNTAEMCGTASWVKHYFTHRTDGFRTPLSKVSTLNSPLKSKNERRLSCLEKQLLSRCFRAWNGRVLGRRGAAQELDTRHLSQTGLRAFLWAGILPDTGAETRPGRYRCRSVIDATLRMQCSGELEAGSDAEKLLKKCFTIWFKHSVNILTMQHTHTIHLQRRALTTWQIYTKLNQDRKYVVWKQHLLWRCRAVFGLWKKRLFQKREADSKYRSQVCAFLQIILHHWHRYQQKRQSLGFQLSLWSFHHNERRKRTIVRTWHCQTMRGQRADLHWQCLSLRRCFYIWRQRRIKSSALKQKILVFQTGWTSLKMRTLFGQWKTHCMAQRNAAVSLKSRRERRISRKAVQRWRLVVLEVRAYNHLRRRRCCWVFLRWKMVRKQRTDVHSQVWGSWNSDILLEKHHNKETCCMLETYWLIWLYQLRLIMGCRAHHHKALRKRAFIKWTTAARIQVAQREAVVHFRSESRLLLLLSYFLRWQRRLLCRKQMGWEYEQHKKRSSSAKNMQRWRAATRGRQVLKLYSTSAVKQACNYWTTAASISLYRRSHHTAIGGRKLRKINMSLALATREQRKFGHVPCKGKYERLLHSSFHCWLLLYKNQSKREGMQAPPTAGDLQPKDRSGPCDGVNGNSQPCQELHRKKLFHKASLSELLHTFQCRHRRYRLRAVWRCWQESFSMALMFQEQDSQRLIGRSWKIWRSRFLQSCTVQNFLEGEEQYLVHQVFTRWRQQTARRQYGQEAE